MKRLFRLSLIGLLISVCWIVTLPALSVAASDATQELPTTATATQRPIDVIETLQTALMAFHESSITATELRAAILQTHDLERLSRLAVGREWHNFSDEERIAVQKAFKELAIASYTNRFGRAQQLTIKTLYSESTAPGRHQVTSQLTLSDNREHVFIFHLGIDDLDQWLIVNILSEGVSDLALKQREFRPHLHAGGPNALVAELENQTALLNAIPSNRYDQEP